LIEIGRQGSGNSSSAETVAKGPISQLQEFVQGAKLFPMPPKCPVLQWEFDTRMTGTSWEFRATVAFLLDGVPHHALGEWKASKKVAQRDVAERALGLFVHRWGEILSLQTSGAERQSNPLLKTDPEDIEGETRRLVHFCRGHTPVQIPTPRWSHRWENGQFQAFVEVRLMEVPHTFPGKPCQSLEAAYADSAKRVLWYLQCPGYEEAFEPDLEYTKAAALTIPEPSGSWAKDDESESEDQQLAERKTKILRVQNHLQQAYSQQLEEGMAVWFWSYEHERSPQEKGGPCLFRATAQVPLASRAFVGAWVRGRREAQIDTCVQISAFLDGLQHNKVV